MSCFENMTSFSPSFLPLLSPVLPPGRNPPQLRPMAKFSTEQEFINQVLTDFARQLIASRIRQVRGQKAIASKELLRSYEYEIRKATVQQTGMALIAFEQHGRFLDMKRANRKNRQIPIDELKKWIKEIGIESFKRVPTTDSKQPLTGQRLLNALAWGIALKIKKRGRYKKRKPLQRGTESLIENLIDELREGFLDRTVDEIKTSLSNSFK